MRKNEVKNVAGALVVGLAAGYIAGLLTAPKSGKDTRTDIKDATSKAYLRAEKQLKSSYSDLGDLMEKAQGVSKDLGRRAKNELNELLEIAQDAQSRAKKLIASARRGDANVPDLDEAIEEAKEAAEDIKSFLKKNK